MDSGSEGDDNISSGGGGGNQSPTEAGSMKKPKRQMKTPFQLETLERTYSMDMYPSEAVRADLSVKLGLTDRQLQMWFCHRRLKGKKEAAGKSNAPAPERRGLTESTGRDETMRADLGSDQGSGSDSDSDSGSGSGQFDNREDMSMVPTRYHESPSTLMERRVIECIEAQLGESLREDGPILGVEFGELPPGAFGTPMDTYGHSHDNKNYGQYNSEKIKVTKAGEPKIKGQVAPSHLYESPVNGHLPRDYGVESQISKVTVLSEQGREVKYPSPSRDKNFVTPSEDLLQMDRKRKQIDESKVEREVNANEKKIRKELERQDILRRKMEEQMKKDMERQDRERQKDNQRLMREQQKREEKFQREEKREMERREKFMQKESIMAERRRQKEEIRLEREAAKQKLAVERAAARRFAKESTELIEDERLELMELAASSKGLPSIVALDYVTLQNLDAFRGSLCEFPPKSVILKKPFAIQPWASSEENIGNVVMAWKFCITFADVLGLWPFTLDEFVQAFHDYDSRLLGEIHITLLKLIIKDIEDVARTPSGGPGTNQYNAVNPEGGHPHIVEGAYMWGFDIRVWQKLLNPLTWPEILRQFALSAGFGPQMKKKKTEQPTLNDNDESKGSEDIIASLRSGAAAENAVATMQEKGTPLQRKSRHRLTPGTVKFAAYHVLALEGSKGLNVIDLAEKIQKAGLRDLSTSKTPEASISVALSRDPILFERIAPSTYNVKSAYRKDPADAEAIIASAKEKIQRFANGFLTEQNADEEEKDDDSECDANEAPEVDDDLNKSKEQENIGASSENVKVEPANDNGVATKVSVPEQEDAEIDESRSGEAWVQGLTEGEYSDLCVEERLNALVALIGVANEGNTIRVVLEGRLDAANVLKKQMWAEAQLDKKRTREENIIKLHDQSLNIQGEGSQSPMVLDSTPVVKDEPSLDPQQNGYTAERSRMKLKSFIGHKAEEMFAYRSLPLGQDRRHNRYWQFVASSSSHDPGSGRIFMESFDGNWRLIDTKEAFDALLTSLDTRGIRESHLHLMLQKIEAPFSKRVSNNPSSGNSSFMSAIESPNSNSLELSSSFKIELGRNEIEKKNAVKRYQDLQMWMWKECFSSSTLCAMINDKKRCSPVLGLCDSCLGSYDFHENFCPGCYKTFSEELHVHDYAKIDLKNIVVSDSPHPLRVRLIKALLNFVEVSMPPAALQSSWTEESRKTWGLKLQSSSSAEDLLQILTRFEGIIKREFLSGNFETTKELLSNIALGKNTMNYEPAYPGYVAQLPWIPQTTAAVALRLFELDNSISYVPIQKAELYDDEMRSGNSTKFPARYGLPKVEANNRVDSLGNNSHVGPVIRGRGSGGRPRGGGGGRSQKGFAGSTSHPSRKPIVKQEETFLTQPRERSYVQKHGRGRRTVRTRRIGNKNVVIKDKGGSSTPKVPPPIAMMSYSNENDEDESNSSGPDEPGRWEVGPREPVSQSGQEMMVSSDEDDDSDDSGSDSGSEEDGGDNHMGAGGDVEMNYNSEKLNHGNVDAESDSGESGDYSDSD